MPFITNVAMQYLLPCLFIFGLYAVSLHAITPPILYPFLNLYSMRTLLTNLSMALLGGLIALVLYQQFDKSSRSPLLAEAHALGNTALSLPLADFTAVAEQAMPSAVHIKTKVYRRNPYRDLDNFWNFWGNPHQNQPQQSQESIQKQEFGSGSGVIISSDGYIVTNNHVIEGADEIEVVLHDKRVLKALVRGTDPSTDLAVLKINAPNLTAIDFGNSDNTKVGEWVMAVGNPFKLASTVTTGIISAKARNIGILENNWAIESFLQTDAAVNPGNSGGALINLKGELIGINTAIATPTGTYAGYSFAIPANIVKKVAGDLIENGQVKRAFLGVSLIEVDSDVAAQLKLSKIEGVYISKMSPKGAAYLAGIRPGDIILQIDNKAVNSTSETLGVIGQFHPNDEVEVMVKRSEKTISFKVRLQGE